MNFSRYSLLAFGLCVLLAACSKQAEGQRCVSTNGNDDCEDGLVCIGARSGANQCDPGNPTVTNVDCQPSLCCPPAPQKSVVDLCNQYQYGETQPDAGN